VTYWKASLLPILPILLNPNAPAILSPEGIVFMILKNKCGQGVSYEEIKGILKYELIKDE
jgi:hypothetical protein